MYRKADRERLERIEYRISALFENYKEQNSLIAKGFNAIADRLEHIEQGLKTIESNGKGAKSKRKGLTA